MVAEVIVDIAGSEVDRIFEYTAIEGVHPGCRVRVPFGGRVIDGYVMRLKEESEFDPSRLKPVAAVVDEALTPECLQLAEALAARYHCPKAQVLRLFLPAEMRRGQVREKQQTWVLPAGGEADISPRAKAQAAALCYLCQEGEAPLAELAAKFGRSAIGALIQKGVFRTEQRRARRTPYTGAQGQALPRALTPAQQAAVDTIAKSSKTVQLVHGVTGSGKTEVYLTLIAGALAAGKSAVFLVPEISLTPQMLLQLRERFGAQAAILHSGLSAGEKFDEWWRLRTGEAKIAIGARSAVFAPVENVGVIIIDEEHDGSYRSETSPRYSTAEVAAFRAKYNGCKLVLGSATPSVDTYRRAETGEYELIRLPERINKKPLPEVVVADMRQEVRRGNAGAFSGALKDELESCLANGNQAIIFLNRRGFAQSVVCRECGAVVKCARCDVSLTYHSEENCLKCHYCGATYKMLTACPSCGGVHLSYTGTGTQKVVGELRRLFPQARILRMDQDTAAGKEGHYKILKRFASREADILVGTQMIAKGHDFPAVTLVGILDADMSLHFSDYRSGALATCSSPRWRGGAAAPKRRAGWYCRRTTLPTTSCALPSVTTTRAFISTKYPSALPPPSRPLPDRAGDGDGGRGKKGARSAQRGVFFPSKSCSTLTRRSFLFFNKMKSPVKRIQDKFRYQVLMRLTGDGLLSQIYERALQYKTRDVLVYVEENPANLS